MTPSFMEKRRAKKQRVQASRDRAVQAQLAEEQEILRLYGKQVTRGRIESSVVELYEKGFVRVLKLKGFDLVGDFERLVSIEGFDGNIQKKSAAGRAAGFVVTGGLNMLASNIRGDMTLQVVTESNVHSISTQVGGQSELESLHRLQTVGKAILDGQRTRQNDTSIAHEPKGISTSLAELSELHQSGALSDDEFAAAKKKLLGD